jgi:hypothetical protein
MNKRRELFVIGVVLIAFFWWICATIIGWSNVRIDYYGKVIDQNDHPLGGVRVRYSIQSLYVFFVAVGGGSKFHEVTTDSNGLFVISGEKGTGLGIESLTKDEYKYSKKAARGGLYSGNGILNYKPDQNHPEIFTMIKRGSADPLVHYDTHLTVPCDGTPARINTMSGKAEIDGDLQITLKREPYNIVFGGPHFSWSAKIEAIGGGLVELVGTGTYRAPQDGYRQQFVFDMSANDPEWGGGIRKVFYIKTRDNRYGRITINLDADYQPPPSNAFLEVYMNPKPGSRNLEYDQNQ